MLRTLAPLRFTCIATFKPAFDLHVLSTPPAFVLSQNQTLRIESCVEYLSTSIIFTFLLSNQAQLPPRLSSRALFLTIAQFNFQGTSLPYPVSRIPSKYPFSSTERQPTPRARPFPKKGKIQPDILSSLGCFLRRPAAAGRVSRMTRNAQKCTLTSPSFQLIFLSLSSSYFISSFLSSCYIVEIFVFVSHTVLFKFCSPFCSIFSTKEKS